MGIDVIPTYPSGYDSSGTTNNPQGSETRREGDDQIRVLKANIAQTTPNWSGPVNATQAEVNRLVGVSLTDKIVTLATGNTVPMMFYLDAAPTGWTIDQTVDEHSVRLTKGSVATGQAGGVSGGTYDFSVLFANLAEGATPGVGDHTLVEAEIPTHNHGGGDHGHGLNYSTVDGNANFDSGTVFGRRDSATNTYARAIAPSGSNANYVVLSGATINDYGGASPAHGHTYDNRLKWSACIMASLD